MNLLLLMERGLDKPKYFLYSKSKDKILSRIFKRRKKVCDFDEFRMSKKQAEESNEVMKILHSNFDTDKKEIYNYGKKSLFRGLMEAYGNHYPNTISPNIILLLFLQGYSRFMENNSEKLRNIYVNFQGKKNLKVVRKGITPETAKPEDWRGIIDEFPKI